MHLVLAAAGFAKRLGGLAKKYPKPMVPIKGKPLLGHVLDRMRRDLPIDSVSIVTRRHFFSRNKIAAFTKDYCKDKNLSFNLIFAKPKGVGFAFYQAVRAMRGKYEQGMIFAVADVLTQDYSPLINSDFQVAIGSVPYDVKARREWTPIESYVDGTINFNPKGRIARVFHSQIGCYYLNEAVLPLFYDIIASGVKDLGKKPEQLNQNRELRVSWVWPEMHAQGVSIGAVNLGKFAELTLPEDIIRFDALLDSDSNIR